ncbi:hypothetical protein ABPG73_006438 [Tetrahymena malaccensis]
MYLTRELLSNSVQHPNTIIQKLLNQADQIEIAREFQTDTINKIQERGAKLDLIYLNYISKIQKSTTIPSTHTTNKQISKRMQGLRQQTQIKAIIAKNYPIQESFNYILIQKTYQSQPKKLISKEANILLNSVQLREFEREQPLLAVTFQIQEIALRDNR